MARQEMLYIELKSDSNDRGPAWIGLATFSGSGRTIYFDGKALKRIRGGGIEGNHYDLKTGEEYWISGVKKDGSDRHWAGSGMVIVDSRVVDNYCGFRGLSQLDPKKYKIMTIADTDTDQFQKLENEVLNSKREKWGQNY